MPIISHDKAPTFDVFPGMHARGLVNKDCGSVSLTVNEAVVDPGAQIPLHIHPTEEAIIILEGSLEATVGDEVTTVGPGKTILAPAGVKHRLVNNSPNLGKIISIFPTTNVERTFV
jgi:quercetin dioxygenase-like cupin family protein